MAIDLRHFRCFVAVAEELHFHRASKRLGVAQPALSRTIQNLENELGVTLFVRTNRTVEITTAGRNFLNGCKEILNKTNQIVEDTQRVHNGKIGTLRIGYTDNAINGRAPAILKAFQQTHPDIQLHLSHTVTSHQLVGLQDDVFDFGFATGSVMRPGFDYYCIQREAFMCVVYEGHRFAKHKSVHLHELAQEQMIQGLAEKWEHFLSYLTPLYRKSGFEPRIAQEAQTTSDILRLVACGMGIAVLTQSVLMPSAGLCVVPIEGVVRFGLDTVVIWKTKKIKPAKSHFISYLKETVPDMLGS
ncbi:UNVERIFIED_CONTAM: hypothetical protein GTU68_067143 [Idotea baltica]|nr:hypothetical protein [Idotea baltica]